jgi:hypothetical protein
MESVHALLREAADRYTCLCRIAEIGLAVFVIQHSTYAGAVECPAPRHARSAKYLTVDDVIRAASAIAAQLTRSTRTDALVRPYVTAPGCQIRRMSSP